MSTTQIKGSQILDGTIESADIDDTLEKEFTKVRVSTNDSTPEYLSTKLVAGPNVTLNVIELSGSNQALKISTHVTGTWEDVGNAYVTTGSVSIDALNRDTSKIGSDVFFYVSGSENAKAVFGGDVVISGSLLFPEDDIFIDGSLLYSVSNVSGSYTTAISDNIVAADAVNGSININLESNPLVGRSIVIKDVAGVSSDNNITIFGGNKMIDGQSSYTISTNYASLSLVFTGQMWSVI
jgi:hypothetical protein